MNGRKSTGISSINGRYKIQRDVKNSIENGEAKELISMTHGFKLEGVCWWEGGVKGRVE